MNQYLSRFTKEQKIARIILSVTVMSFAVWYTVVDMQHSGFASYLPIGDIGFSFAHIPMMVLAGLFGYVQPMIFTVIVFFFGAVTDIQSSYQVFLFLLISAVTYLFVSNCETRSASS